MDKPTCGLVLTTIFDPVLLDGYLENFRAFGHLDRVRVFVIPDHKTPPAVYARCQSLRSRGLDVVCPTIEEQERFLGQIARLIPYDSDNRRNVGFLMALDAGVDFLISIDDDNFCQSHEDFFSEHCVVCQEAQNLTVVDSSTGWLNACDLLVTKPNYRVYPRGFPYHKRHRDAEFSDMEVRGLIRMNVGLWLLEPDLDAITWLVAPVTAESFRGQSLVLGPRTWAPINTQNTALHRDVIPSYYYIRMGYPLAGFPIDRYGDIFSGYFSQACVRHLGHKIRLGTPIVEHRRNSHNCLRDAASEMSCIWILEDLVEWLREAKLGGDTYSETYVFLSYAIEEAVEHFSGSIWTDVVRGYFHQMAYCMRQWLTACWRVGYG